MVLRQKTGLDSVAAALTRHVMAVEARQSQSESGELRPSDLASIVKAAEVLQALEFDRVNILMKVLGRRIATMSNEELAGYITLIMTYEHEADGAEKRSS